MKIYEIVQNEKEKSLKVFGFTLMMTNFHTHSVKRYKKFLGNFVQITKSKESLFEPLKKEIRIFGHLFLLKEECKDGHIYFIFGKIQHKSSFIRPFKRKYLKYFDKETDDIYILNANIGEIYLVLTCFIDSLIKKNKSKKPLLVATQKYHSDLIAMICPHIDFVYIKMPQINIDSFEFKIDDFRFFLLFSTAYFTRMQYEIKNQNTHYHKFMLKKFDISPSYNKVFPCVKDEKIALSKALQMGLNLDNFVFLAPEANSCVPYDRDFWTSLIEMLFSKGYDVFVNFAKKDILSDSNLAYKSCFLSLQQAFVLARHSKRIISLRSGFVELLTQTGVCMDILYTREELKKRFLTEGISAFNMLKGFSLKELPFVEPSKLREFDTFKTSASQILKSITKEL